ASLPDGHLVTFFQPYEMLKHNVHWKTPSKRCLFNRKLALNGLSCLLIDFSDDNFPLTGEHEKPRGSHRMMPSTGVKITTIIS
ncbi:hypothetical protein, partial [Klebsiella pneumoniae]|uniref:hypothetical protein n=1 Tax=Klebsiella pneumoniae TaxID=573 RepID=UPI0019679E32